MNKPSLSLVTCTLGRQDKLLRLLESLTLQNVLDFELILVDQNPPGFLSPLVDPFKSRFTINHFHTPKGLSLGRNAGIKAAQGALVAFPDDDCWYRPGTISNIIALFEKNKNHDFITGRTFDNTNIPSVSPTFDFETPITRNNYLLCGNSNAIFARTNAVRQIGGFDERLGVGAATPFQSGEEADILLRAINEKMSLVYNPQIIVHHDQVTKLDPKVYIERAAKYGAGFGALLKKHNFSKIMVGTRIARSLVSGFLHYVKSNRIEARYKFAWAKGIYHGYRSWQ
jgi:glycosyltransferase involved in cell wall biosynthesis